MEYFAHIHHKDSDRKQTVKEHNENVANIAKQLNLYPNLKYTVYLSGLLHDIGKNCDYFQQYLINSVYNKKEMPKKSHSTSGAKIIYDEFHNKCSYDDILACELISLAISSHHGVYDCINIDGDNKFEERMKSQLNTVRIPQTRNELKMALKEQNIDDEKILKIFEKSVREIVEIVKKIESFDKKNMMFYLCLLERMILSVLIDADRIDTEIFEESDKKEKFNIDFDEEKTKKLFSDLLNNLNSNINKFEKDTNISKIRREFSDRCLNFSKNNTGIYRLVIPTGGGKTLSSLRYALNHAKIYNKQHIFYIAPFMSILEQNSVAIRKFINNEDVVLEHHSNIIFDEEDDKKENDYKLLTENWNHPIVTTTLVQLLNTLFFYKTSCIRRFHSLTNSVIIIDEIQSLPIKCISLFNLACNFLSKVCNTTIILCSATQPTLDENLKHKIILNEPSDIIDEKEIEKYSSVFKRTDIIDNTEKSYSNSEIAYFILEKIKNLKSLLMVVNTKTIAKEVYEEINKNNKENIKIFHLSTNMCPAHRKDIIDLLKKELNGKEKVVCITTQLIEAGVDISFECVIRSLAGLDNIAQAAGRCNRNGEYNEIKKVYIVHLKDENLNKLKEIKDCQGSTNNLLTKYKNAGKCLLDKDIIKEYYNYLLNVGNKNDTNILNYKIDNINTNILEMLSNNDCFVKEYKRKYSSNPKTFLKQAFKTAGENFKVINDYSRDVIVYYKKSKELILNLSSNISLLDKKKIVKKLQQYCIGLNKTDFKKLELEKQIFFNKEIGIYILNEKFYDESLGFCFENKNMETLFI